MLLQVVSSKHGRAVLACAKLSHAYVYQILIWVIIMTRVSGAFGGTFMTHSCNKQVVFATLLGPILACAYQEEAMIHAGDAANSMLWVFLGGSRPHLS